MIHHHSLIILNVALLAQKRSRSQFKCNRGWLHKPHAMIYPAKPVLFLTIALICNCLPNLCVTFMEPSSDLCVMEFHHKESRATHMLPPETLYLHTLLIAWT